MVNIKVGASVAVLLTTSACASLQEAASEMRQQVETAVTATPMPVSEPESVALGQTIRGAINPVGDEDKYVLDVRPGEEFQVIFNTNYPASSKSWVGLEVFPYNRATQRTGYPAGKVSLELASAEPKSTGLIRAESPGTYMIHVQEPQRFARGGYSFEVRPIVPKPVSMGVPVRGEINPVGDEDKYLLEVKPGQEFQVIFNTNYPATGDTWLALEVVPYNPATQKTGYPAGKVSLQFASAEPKSTGTIRATGPGVYKISVEPVQAFGRGGYSLEVRP